MSIQAAYDRWSSTYDSDINITRDLDESLTRKQFAGCHFRTALEFGCGTGKNTSFFSEIANEVVAFDISPGMIEIARQRVLAPNVVFGIADIAEKWVVGDRSQHLISCNLILQHVEDLRAVFAEAARALAPEGWLFISELHPIKKYQGSMARYVWDGQPQSVPAYNHQISDYVSAAYGAGLSMLDLKEWWHDEDANKPPRLVTFVFTTSPGLIGG